MAGPRVKPEDDAPGSLIFAFCLSEFDIDATKGCFKNESRRGERDGIAVTNLIRALSLRRDKKIHCAGTRMSLRQPQGHLANILKISLNLRLILGIMAKNDTYSLHAGTSAALTGLSRMANSSQPRRVTLIFQTCRPIFEMRLPWPRPSLAISRLSSYIAFHSTRGSRGSALRTAPGGFLCWEILFRKSPYRSAAA